MSQLIITDQNTFEIPENVAVCPYCSSKLSATVEGTELHGDGWRAYDINTDCHNEPDIDSDEWDDWLNQHSYMPYTYQLPVDEKIIEWINKTYRFKQD